MRDYTIEAACVVSETDLANVRLGPRAGRMDLASKLSSLAVDSLGIDLSGWPSGRVGLCLAARAGSLSTDVEFWQGRDAVGGPSPNLFVYTLPSAALGEIAIRHKLTGPNICLVGGSGALLVEAGDLIARGEADACLCVFNQVVTPALAGMIDGPVISRAGAVFLVAMPAIRA